MEESFLALRPNMEEDVDMDTPHRDTPVAASSGFTMKDKDMSSSPTPARKDKGKAKMVAMPTIPDDVWSVIFEHYYAQRSNEWTTSGHQKGLLQPLLICKQLAPLSLSALYDHPHLSFRTIAPFIRSLSLPSPYLTCPKRQLVKHLTVAPSPSPSSLRAENRAKSSSAYTIHTHFRELTALLPPLQSLTLKDTLIAHEADADLLLDGLELLRPSTAHIQLRMWNIFTHPSAERILALTRGPTTTFSEHRPSPEDAQDLVREVVNGGGPDDWLEAMEWDMELRFPARWYQDEGAETANAPAPAPHPLPWLALLNNIPHPAPVTTVAPAAPAAPAPAFVPAAGQATNAGAAAMLSNPAGQLPNALPNQLSAVSTGSWNLSVLPPPTAAPAAFTAHTQAAQPPASAPPVDQAAQPVASSALVWEGDSGAMVGVESGDEDDNEEKEDGEKKDEEKEIDAQYLEPLADDSAAASDDGEAAEGQTASQVWWAHPTDPPSSPLPSPSSASPSRFSRTHSASPPSPPLPAPHLPIPSYLRATTSPDGVHLSLHTGYRHHHLAGHLRSRLGTLFSTTWAPELTALYFTALDPLAALAVSDPAQELWPEVAVPTIRVHLPRAVSSLTLFKGPDEFLHDDRHRESPSPTSSPEKEEARIVGGTGQGEGLLNPATTSFEVELNSVKEVIDGTWITYGDQLPPVLSRVLAGSSDWRCSQVDDNEYGYDDSSSSGGSMSFVSVSVEEGSDDASLDDEWDEDGMGWD
ncbi:hypothetical protein IAT38_007834 [Cryptococcus sp. DSM 104549]